MADLLANLPLGTLLPVGRHGAPGSAGIVLSTRPLAAATLVAGRDRSAVATALEAAFGLAPVDAPRHVAAGNLAFVGTGPGRWLVLSEGADLAARLTAVVGPSASVFDQSGGMVVLSLEGAALSRLIEKLVPLDFDPAAFPVGSAATTTLAHVNVTLWTETEGTLCIAVGRSYFAAFLRGLLSASAECGLDWRG